ncbi:MAG: TonB-dependent siderophore receptor, partial [Bacteroidota bacterium]
MTRTSFLSLLLCANGILSAQNDLSTPSDSSRLREVVITAAGTYQAPLSPVFSRLSLRNQENPQSVQVVTPALLRDRQVQSVGEALSLAAGASLLASAQYGEYVMRGFKMSPGNFAFNGIRGDFFQVDQAALTYNMERIEIMKGPASVLFSAGNPGGVINHVTKTPLADRAMSVQYTFGSFNQHRTVLDATGPLDGRRRLLARFIAGYENTGQYDRNQQIRNLFLAPQLEYRFRDSSFVR